VQQGGESNTEDGPNPKPGDVVVFLWVGFPLTGRVIRSKGWITLRTSHGEFSVPPEAIVRRVVE